MRRASPFRREWLVPFAVCMGAAMVLGPATAATTRPAEARDLAVTNSALVRPESSTDSFKAAQRDPKSTIVLDPAAGIIASFKSTNAKKKNRPTSFQIKTGSTWKTIGRSKQSSTGKAVLKASLTPRGTYRVVAEAYKGKKAMVTSAVALSTSWDLVFDDEFSGDALDSTRWAIRQEGQYFGRRQCAASAPGMSTVSQGYWRGTVALSPEVASMASCPFGFLDNAHVSTERKFTFTHGLISARVKFPEAAGQHGSVWLQTACASKTCKPVEVDFVEFFGRKSNESTSTPTHLVHLSNVKQGGGYSLSTQRAGSAYYEKFHDFSVVWDETGYTFWIDGVQSCWRVGKAKVCKVTEAVGDSPSFLVMSLLTSDWELPRLDVNRLPNSMMVDWVRVYQRR